MATKATSGKLRTALIAIEAFQEADDYQTTIKGSERIAIQKAWDTLAAVESRLYTKGR